MYICVDPGHGGKDPGAIGQLSGVDIYEKDITLSIALYLDRELSMLGHTVYLTRRIDRTLSLGARASFANKYAVDLFISVHCNSAESNAAEGIETWIYPYSDKSRLIANNVQGSLATAFANHRDRGVKEANFQVLRETRMPAILVETEFINNKKQVRFLSNPNNQIKIANAIAYAI